MNHTTLKLRMTRAKIFLSLTLLLSINSYAMEEPQATKDNTLYPHLQKNEESTAKINNKQNSELPPPIVPQALQNIQQPAQLEPAKESLVARGCNLFIKLLTKLKEKSVQQKQPNNNRAQASNHVAWISSKDLVSLGLNLLTIQQSMRFNSGARYIPTVAPKLFRYFGDIITPGRIYISDGAPCTNGPDCPNHYKKGPDGTYSFGGSNGDNNFKSFMNTYSYLPLLITTALHGASWYQNWRYRQLKNKYNLTRALPHNNQQANNSQALIELRQAHDTMIGYPQLMQRVNNAGALLSTVLFGLLKYNSIDHSNFYRVLGLQAASYLFNSYVMYAHDKEYKQESQALNNRFEVSEL